MNRTALHKLRLLAWPLAGLLLAVVFGCNSPVPPGSQEGTAQAPSKAVATAPASDDPGIDLECAADRIQKAPAPFHWSYKKIVPPQTNADWEADVSLDSIAGTVIDSSGTRAIHAVRSDNTSWNTAMLLLTGPLPASTFALVNNSSATARTGTENVNGESTIKYAIDTSRDTPADASLIKNILGANGFVKGSAWVTPDGCPVKFVLDVEQHLHDGSVEKEHYEENVTKR
ncbi:MAG: hypothetical protein ACRD4V_10170 [Candidatus Acidiferrales bacterium]